jgi:hypothetical protein
MSRDARSRGPCQSRCASALTVTALFFAVLAAVAGPAAASQEITAFSVSTSTTQAGAHPDLTASFDLAAPGNPEAARNIAVDMPQGAFGNPGAILKCTASEFVVNECAPGSQAGFITVFADYNGNEHYLLGTAPLFNMQTVSEDEAGRLAFVAPVIQVPVNIRVTVRTASDYGLRLIVAGIPQLVPVAHVNLTVWGQPAEAVHNAERFDVGSPGAPPGCPESTNLSCISGATQAGQIVRPFINNPSVCTGQSLPVRMSVETYEDPEHLTHAEAAYPPTSGCDKQDFKPVLNAGLTSREADAPAGMDLQLKADQFLGNTPSPSQLRSAVLTLPEGLSINPDAADGQTSCTDGQAGFGSERRSTSASRSLGTSTGCS